LALESGILGALAVRKFGPPAGAAQPIMGGTFQVRRALLQAGIHDSWRGICHSGRENCYSGREIAIPGDVPGGTIPFSAGQDVVLECHAAFPEPSYMLAPTLLSIDHTDFYRAEAVREH